VASFLCVLLVLVFVFSGAILCVCISLLEYRRTHFAVCKKTWVSLPQLLCFITARSNASAVYALVMRLCVSTRLSVGSREQWHAIAHRLSSLLLRKISANLSPGHPQRSGQSRWGRLFRQITITRKRRLSHCVDSVVRSQVYHTEQYICRDAARRAGSSATADTCLTRPSFRQLFHGLPDPQRAILCISVL